MSTTIPVRRTFGALQVGFMLGTGLLGWAAVMFFTLHPVDRFRAVVVDAELLGCFAMVLIARLLSFPVFGRVRIALDSAFYVATAFIHGTVSAAWLMLITLTLDNAWRWLRGSGLIRRGDPVLAGTGVLFYAGGLPALVLVTLGLIVDDGRLYPLGDSTLSWVLPLFSLAFLVVHYFLAGSLQWFGGSSSSRLLKGYFMKTVLAEIFLVPVSLAMVMGHEHQGQLLYFLVGATGLVFNVIFRRAAIAQRKLAERVDELSTINRIGSIIASSLERDRLLRNLAQETLKLVGHESRLMVGVFNEDRSQLVYDVFNESGERYKQMMVPAGQGLSGWVTAERKPLLMGDIQNEWRKYLKEYAHNDPKYHSWLGVPLSISDDVRGVVVVQSKEAYAYSPEHLRVLRTIADQAAMALENARLYELATVDGLTGLFVRRYFDQRLVEEWDRAERYGAAFSVVLLDLDNFKKLNDTYGHQAGDHVLRAAAATVRNNMRSFDIPARYGGEEFVFILPRTDVHDAQVVAERIRADIDSKPVQAGNDSLKVTVSMGLASFPACADAHGPWDLVAKADAALYLAKKRGKNRIVVAGEPQDAPGRPAASGAN